MEDKIDLKRGLRNLLILKAQIKGTSYLEEPRLLNEQWEERKENRKIMDKDVSEEKEILKEKTENKSAQIKNEQQLQ